MSRATLFAAGPDGDLQPVKEYANSWRGAMLIWQSLIDRHLPGSLPKRGLWLGNEAFMEQIWQLAYRVEVPWVERVCLMATFDRALVRGSERAALANAFRSFMTLVEPSCHLAAMAADLEALPEETRAVGWQWTSVAATVWRVAVAPPDGEEDERPYNIDRDGEHFWLFEEVP